MGGTKSHAHLVFDRENPAYKREKEKTPVPKYTSYKGGENSLMYQTRLEMIEEEGGVGQDSS